MSVVGGKADIRRRGFKTDLAWMTAVGGYCCKSRKSNNPKNLDANLQAVSAKGRSFASVWPDHGDFRSTPVNGHAQDRRACLKGANTRHQSITRSARLSSVGGMITSSALAVLTLIVRTSSVGCSTGTSATLAPRRSFVTCRPHCRLIPSRRGP
jgi:hypothetical protein